MSQKCDMLKVNELRQKISNYKNNFEKICKSFVMCENVIIFAVLKYYSMSVVL